MTDGQHWIPGRLVRAALDVPERVRTLGTAAWLYLYVLAEVGHHGRLCRPASRIAADLGVPDAEIETWLTRLTDAGLVMVLSPSPYLVIKLPLWSGSAPHQAPNLAANSGAGSDVHLEVPVSSSFAAAAASGNHGEVGGRGEGEGLLREVLAAFDEADPAEFRTLIGQHPPAVVRRALRRVQATPPSQIRKSKAALFRYLLGKFT